MDAALRISPVEKVHVITWLHTDKDPPADEWEAGCLQVADYIQVHSLSMSELRVFVVSDGGAPNAVQRKRYLREVQTEPVLASALLSGLEHNPFLRGLCTAIQWMNPKVRFFAPSQLVPALKHIGISNLGFEVIWRDLQELQKLMTPNPALRTVATDRVRLARTNSLRPAAHP